MEEKRIVSRRISDSFQENQLHLGQIFSRDYPVHSCKEQKAIGNTLAKAQCRWLPISSGKFSRGD
jgi:hypothetical protein